MHHTAGESDFLCSFRKMVPGEPLELVGGDSDGIPTRLSWEVEILVADPFLMALPWLKLVMGDASFF